MADAAAAATATAGTETRRHQATGDDDQQEEHLLIRHMRPDELKQAMDIWKEQGLEESENNVSTFYQVDPEGFFVTVDTRTGEMSEKILGSSVGRSGGGHVRLRPPARDAILRRHVRGAQAPTGARHRHPALAHHGRAPGRLQRGPQRRAQAPQHVPGPRGLRPPRHLEHAGLQRHCRQHRQAGEAHGGAARCTSHHQPVARGYRLRRPGTLLQPREGGHLHRLRHGRVRSSRGTAAARRQRGGVRFRQDRHQHPGRCHDGAPVRRGSPGSRRSAACSGGRQPADARQPHHDGGRLQPRRRRLGRRPGPRVTHARAPVLPQGHRASPLRADIRAARPQLLGFLRRSRVRHLYVCWRDRWNVYRNVTQSAV